MNRAVYTYRIMDIIRQVRKQKAEIGRIIGDIRAMQKQINSMSGKLQRTEAVAEERLYQGASSFKGKDQNVVDAYKEFSRLRDVRCSLPTHPHTHTSAASSPLPPAAPAV